MTPTEQFIARKKVEAPNSRTLRMLEKLVRFVAKVEGSGDYISKVTLQNDAMMLKQEIDRIASEPLNAAQPQNGD